MTPWNWFRTTTPPDDPPPAHDAPDGAGFARLQVALIRSELHRRNLQYGRASATIGALRDQEARLRSDLRAERAAREIAEARAESATNCDPWWICGRQETKGPAESAARDTTVIARADRYHCELGDGEQPAQRACHRLTMRLHELLTAGERHITIGEAFRLIANIPDPATPFLTDAATAVRTFTDGGDR